MDGTALVFCEGAFGRWEGKIANALVRYGTRYRLLGVLDSRWAGRDAGDVVEGASRRIPVFSDLAQALRTLDCRPDFLVMGLSSDSGRMRPEFRAVVKDALRRGISVDSAMRPYLREDAEFPGLAQGAGARLRSIGYPPSIAELREATGRLRNLPVFRVAVVGTCAASGIVTTSFVLTEALRSAGRSAELLGTGETSWFQGAPYTLILDSIPARFVPGELEAVAVQAVEERSPEVLVIEGQGSVVNPDNISGLAVLTAAAPGALVLQHAPIHCASASDAHGLRAVERHLRLYELLTDCPVVAITISHEGLSPEEAESATEACRSEFGLPVTDVLAEPPSRLAELVVAASARERPN